MRIEQLEYVIAVARLGSFRGAAEQLHISQPALSETVRNLERELGVDIFERRRSGATVSDSGREFLPHIVSVLDAIDKLRRAADEQHRAGRMIRIGTVNTATVQLLSPTIRRFRQAHPETQVEIVGAQQAEIDERLLEGSLDLGLVNFLAGDDETRPELETTRLLSGQVVVCVKPDSPLARLAAVSTDDLLSEPVIVMRSGYVMHRFFHRLVSNRSPSISYSTDGAEMGKLMVALGLGATLLPDFSVIGDPMEESGDITYRPLADHGTDTGVRLALRRRKSRSTSQATRALQAFFVEQARSCDEQLLRPAS